MENADEVCESSGKLKDKYPPWQAAPQAGSKRPAWRRSAAKGTS